jgi:hypothetical protein
MIALLAEGPARMDNVVTVPSAHPITAKEVHNLNGTIISVLDAFLRAVSSAVFLVAPPTPAATGEFQDNPVLKGSLWRCLKNRRFWRMRQSRQRYLHRSQNGIHRKGARQPAGLEPIVRANPGYAQP